MCKSSFLLLFIAFVGAVSGFTVQPLSRKPSITALGIGPLAKFANKGNYDETVENLMKVNGWTREEAEKEYDAYLDNPTNYALTKGEEYYKSLGYKSIMEGVIGEAEKEGKGDEVRQRLDDFKKESTIKSFSMIGFFIAALVYGKLQHDAGSPLF